MRTEQQDIPNNSGQVIGFITKLLQYAKQENCSRLDFEVSGDIIRVSSTPSTSQNLSLEGPGFGTSFFKTMVERSFFWPESDASGSASGNSKPRRILWAPIDGMRCRFELSINRKSGSNIQTLTLMNLHFDGVEAAVNILELNEKSKTSFQTLKSATNGIFIGSSSKHPHHADGCAVLLACIPHAVYIRQCSTAEVAHSVLEVSKQYPVVVGIDAWDPLEAAMLFLGHFGENQEMKLAASQRLRAAMIYANVRRVCSACAKSTPVDTRTIDRVPMVLRSSMKSSYMFGRGCDRCGHSAYFGEVGLESFLEWDSACQELFRNESSVTEIAKHCYKSGTRSLLEDGLQKIFSGKTSFEEMFSVSSQIPAHFSAAIAAASPDSPEVQNDGVLEGMTGETFLMGQTASSQRQQTPTVMIVEDDRDQRSVLEMVFKNAGYEVVVAENGQVALISLQNQAVDAIICDVMMPVMNGAQLVRSLKETPTLKNIPVLMLTAVTNPEAEYTLLKHGADDYCEKNVKKKVLLKRVERLLSKRPKNPLQHMLD